MVAISLWSDSDGYQRSCNSGGGGIVRSTYVKIECYGYNNETETAANKAIFMVTPYMHG